jgi:hypothetical protein
MAFIIIKILLSNKLTNPPSNKWNILIFYLNLGNVVLNRI